MVVAWAEHCLSWCGTLRMELGGLMGRTCVQKRGQKMATVLTRLWELQTRGICPSARS